MIADLEVVGKFIRNIKPKLSLEIRFILKEETNMESMEVIMVAFLSLISLSFIIGGYFQFKEKGILFNNAYLYASAEERKNMNKKPHYRQSAVVFIVLGLVFLLVAIESIIHSGWMFNVVYGLILLVIIYAIASTIFIYMKYK